MEIDKEIRIPGAGDFLCEVDLDDEGEIVLGKHVKGEFRQMRLATLNARAIEIASQLPQGRGGQIRRNPVSKNSI